MSLLLKDPQCLVSVWFPGKKRKEVASKKHTPACKNTCAPARRLVGTLLQAPTAAARYAPRRGDAAAPRRGDRSATAVLAAKGRPRHQHAPGFVLKVPVYSVVYLFKPTPTKPHVLRGLEKSLNFFFMIKVFSKSLKSSNSGSKRLITLQTICTRGHRHGFLIGTLADCQVGFTSLTSCCVVSWVL